MVVPSVHVAPEKSAFSKSAPSSRAPLKFAPIRIASKKRARRRSAPLNDARVRLAFVKSVPTPRTPLKSASGASTVTNFARSIRASVNLAPAKLARRNLDPPRFPPLTSTPLKSRPLKSQRGQPTPGRAGSAQLAWARCDTMGDTNNVNPTAAATKRNLGNRNARFICGESRRWFLHVVGAAGVSVNRKRHETQFEGPRERALIGGVQD